MAFSSPNYTQTPNDFFDEILKTLKEGELRVILIIIRQTLGWRKKSGSYQSKSISRKDRYGTKVSVSIPKLTD